MKFRNTSSISISSFTQRRKLFFISFLLLATLIISCKKESDVIGLQLQPESEILNALINDTSTLITYPVREDSVRTDGRVMLFNNLLGSYADPVFGMTTAGFYSQFRLTTGNISFGQVQVDSLVLTLAYSGYYGDTTTAQTFSVYRMTEAMQPDTNYYSNQEFAIDNNPVGTITFQPRPTTMVDLPDTTLGPHIRISLDNSFGTDILNSGAGANNDSWLQYLPGLYIKAEDVFSGGAILYINYASALTRLSLYYSDTAQYVYDFAISAQSARVNNYTHDYQVSVSPIQFDDPIQGGINTYIQSMAGVKTRLVFPHLSDLAEAGPVAINKAELIIKIADGSDAVFAPHDRLVLFASDSIGRNVVLPDQLSSATSGFFGGDYNASTKEYRFNIPRYVQDIINGNRENYGLFILASGAASNANRTIAVGGLDMSQSRMKLRIIYTRIQ